MSIFSDFSSAREVKRQMKLDNVPESARKRIESAEITAKQLNDRVDKLTKEKRDGTKPIEGADVAELDAILSEADALTKGLEEYPYILTENILAVQYRARQAVNGERNRRYKVRSDALGRLNNAQATFQRPLFVIGNSMKAYVEAMETYPLDKLLEPCEVVCGSVQPPITVTAEDAAAMTDKELSDAINKAYMQAHDAIGPAMFVDEVSRMLELLPEVIEAMESYRDSRIEDKRQAGESHGILVAEQKRRKAEAERIAAQSNRPMADRITELEQVLADMRKGA